VWIRSGDIRDQSRKLSEIIIIIIAHNFGRFFALQILGAGLPKVVPILSPLLYGTSNGKKFCEDSPISPEVLFARMMNFKPDFKFSRLKFLGGPPSLLGCALASVPQSLAHVKI